MKTGKAVLFTTDYTDFLAQNDLHWSQVHGVGLAIPGPYERCGVFAPPNLPDSFSGWDVPAP